MCHFVVHATPSISVQGFSSTSAVEHGVMFSVAGRFTLRCLPYLVELTIIRYLLFRRKIWIHFLFSWNLCNIGKNVPSCDMHLRSANNFAKDDPSWWPQPFHPLIGHLAVILSPIDSPSYPLQYAWYQPEPSDFETVLMPGLTGVVCLTSVVVHEVSCLCDTLWETILALPLDLHADSYL